MRWPCVSPLVLLFSNLLVATSAAQEQPPQQQPPPSVPAPPVASGESKQPLLQCGFGLMMGVPLGDFRENVAFSVGGTAHLDFGLGRSPVSIGAEGTYLWYGTEGRNVPLVGLPGLAVGVDTENDMLLLHGRVRVQQREGRVRPHVDGLVGVNYISTSTTVDAEEYCYSFGSTYQCSDDGDSLTNLDDFVLSAGGGGGVQIALDAAHSMRLDLSARYLYGGEAEYLTEGDLRWSEDGAVILQPRRSRTDMLMVYVGLTWGR